MSLEERKSACPPSWNAPTSNDTRVRVEDLAKSIPKVLPASGFSWYAPLFIRAASVNRASTSALERSWKTR
jgi:hypothetical protein